MIAKIAWVFVMAGLACTPAAKDQMEKEGNRDRVFLYSQGVPQEIRDANAAESIIVEVTRLFSEADDFYWKAISDSDIEEFRRKGCVEVIFANAREIVIEAVKETRIISRLLIPLDEAMCSHDAHIIYGDPEYDSFNLLLNSQGCGTLKKLVEDISPTE